MQKEQDNIDQLRKRLQDCEDFILRIAKPFTGYWDKATEEVIDDHLGTRKWILDEMFEKLAKLAVFEQINYNIEEVVSTVQKSPSEKHASKRLRSIFGIGPAEADFLLDLTIEEMAYYFNRENCEKEIAQWSKLKEVLVQ